MISISQLSLTITGATRWKTTAELFIVISNEGILPSTKLISSPESREGIGLSTTKPTKKSTRRIKSLKLTIRRKSLKKN